MSVATMSKPLDVLDELNALKASGELDDITVQWMSEYTEAPIISAA